jgi:hypothetical protein
VVQEDPFHGISRDLVPEVGQRVADPRVAPPRILYGHPDDELCEIARRQRPASTSAGAAVVLLGDQSAVPAQDRVGRDDACRLSQCPPSPSLAAHCESAALGVSQAQRLTAELFAEDPILLSQIVDQVLLVAARPSSESEDQETQSMGHCPRLRREDTARNAPCPAIRVPRPIICTRRGCPAAQLRSDVDDSRPAPLDHSRSDMAADGEDASQMCP